MNRRFKKISLFILLILSLSGLLAVSVLVDRPVEIKDQNFELAIRQKLDYHGKPLYRSQLLGFVELDLSNNGIYRIDGIEYFRNLEILNLRHNNLSDVSPLRTLTNLRILDIGYNRIINLEDANFNQLNNLQLQELNLDYNVVYSHDHGTVRLSDVNLLSQHTSLKYLSLEHNHIADLSPLGELILLEELNLKKNQLERLDGIESLENLIELNLRENRLIDISSIHNLVELRYLNLHTNDSIEDISALSNLINLETLIMRHVPIGNQIDVLAGMTQLLRLNIRNCSVSDFTVLFDLMASGALQDQPEIDRFAYLDIHENEIPNDPYHLRGFRPYWDNIQVKYPFELNDSILPTPEYSVADGFYQSPFILELSTHLEDVSIHYTMDGSIPSLESPMYHSPLLIGEENIDGDVNLAATVIRARLFENDGYDASPTITLTFFVGENSADLFSLPIVSLVTNPDYFFDPEIGIYYQDNYRERGKKWERPIHLTLYDYDEVISQGALVRIHGGISRGAAQKPLRFYAENNYAINEYFRYPIFPDYYATGLLAPLERFSTFIFRNSGNDVSGTFFRDGLIHKLMSHTSQDIQAYRPVNVYLNGEYWGIYNIRERLDEFYIENHYGLLPDQITIYSVDANEDFYGQSRDDNEFLQLIDLVKTNDINDEEFYEFLLTQIDVDNFIDNQIIYIYSANGDWLWNNVRFWRKNVEEIIPNAPYWYDGRWRWMVHDMDKGFHRVDSNLLRLAISDHEGAVLMNALVENPTFLEKFINRFADHLNTSFQESRVIELIDQMASYIEPDMPFHIARWKTMDNSIAQWHENVIVMREFALLRPDFVRQHIIGEFDLSGTSEITLQVNTDYGYIRINTIDILEDTPGVYDPSIWTGVYFQDVPITITAVPKPGYSFSHWEGVDHDLIFANDITFLPEENMNIKAIFATEPQN